MQPCDLLFIFRHSPYGSSLGREGLEAALAAGAFEQNMAILFLDDGVFQLINNQAAEAIQRKSHQKMSAALPLFGIDTLYAASDSLKSRNIDADATTLDVQLLSTDEICTLMNSAKTVLSF